MRGGAGPLLMFRLRQKQSSTRVPPAPKTVSLLLSRLRLGGGGLFLLILRILRICLVRPWFN